jgi:hypothetical protein
VSEISVSLGSTQVTLVNGRSSLTASVTNASADVERVVLGVYASPGAAAAPPTAGPVVNPVSWTTVERPLREIGPGATEQYVVSFEATGAPAGTYGLKAIAYPADRAPEEYSDRGQTLQVIVPAEPVQPPPPKRPWWIFILVAVLLAALGGVAYYLTRPAAELAMPDVAGLSQVDARNRLVDAGFTGILVTATVNQPGLAQDIAVRTEPAAGEVVAAGADITLVLATGLVEVPDLTGARDDDAAAALEALDLVPAFSGTRPGTVTSQDRTGLAPVDATVTLTIDPDEPFVPPCTPWPKCILPDVPVVEIPEQFPLDRIVVEPGF